MESKCIDITRIPLTYLIKGNWGIGKSFLWNKLTEINKNKKINFIKVSLFGVESIEILDRKLKVEYLKKDSRVKEGFQQTLKIMNKKFANGQVDILPFITFSESFIICFDDVERKSEKLSLKDLMGYIENISIKSTVFILMNEKKLKDDADYESYIEYKEKLIDYEYELTEISNEMCKNVLSYSNLESIYKLEIIKVFQSHNQSNYRTLIKIERLVQNLLFELKKLSVELVRLSSTVVIEGLRKNVVNEFDNNKDKEKMALFLYKLKIKEYLETGIINTSDFDKIIYSVENTDNVVNETNEILNSYTHKMNDIFLKNEVEFVKLYKEILRFVNESIGLKLDTSTVIDLWKPLRSYKEKFIFLYKEKDINLDEQFMKLVLGSLKQMTISELEIFNDDLNLRFTLYNDRFISKELVEKLIPLVEKIMTERKLGSLNEFLKDNKYEEAIQIFKSYPALILEKIEIFDVLIEEELSISLYVFLKQVSLQANNSEIVGNLNLYLKKLEKSTDDIIIKERFQTFDL